MATASLASVHLLLQADPGRADDVASHLATMKSVTETVVTSGPYDVIARVDGEADVPRVLAEAKRAPGLARLCVCRSA
jgi:uncharacterized protein with GYD domain